MAPLTWQNVAAPNFSGAIAARRTAADIMANGFGGLQTALQAFDQQRLAQAKFDQESQLANAKFADDHRRALLGDETVTQTNIGLTEANSQEAWKNSNTRSFEAARPAANDLVGRIKYFSQLGTPEGRQKAAELTRDGSTVLSNAGIDVDGIIKLTNGNLSTTDAGIQTNANLRGQTDALTARDRKLEADKLIAGAWQKTATTADAAEFIRNSSADPSVASIALERIAKEGDSLWGSTVDPTRTILDQRIAEERQAAQKTTNRILYQNQNSTRNDPLSNNLSTAISPILDKYGVTMKVFSGGQETAQEVSDGKGNRTGSKRHDHGNAADVEFFAADGHKLMPNNPQDLAILQGIVKSGMESGIEGWGEGDDYMGPGRIHLGYGPRAIWGKNGSSDNAPKWLLDAANGVDSTRSSRINDAFNPTPTPTDVSKLDPIQEVMDAAKRSNDGVMTANRTAADTTLVNPASALLRNSADYNQSLLDRSVTLQSQGQTLVDTMTADSARNKDAALIETLTNRPDGKLDKNSVIDKLHKDMGDEDGLTRDQVADELNMVMDKYGMAPDIAAAFLKDSVDQTTWGARFLYGKRSVYDDKLDQQVKRLYGDGVNQTEGLQSAVARIQQGRTKEISSKKVSDMLGQVEKAKTEYFTALAKKNAGRSSVDTATALRRYEMVQDMLQKELDKIAGNPLTTANTKSLTAR